MKSSRPRIDWVTSSTRPVRSTAATTCSASAMVYTIDFVTITCLPASSAARICAACSGPGV